MPRRKEAIVGLQGVISLVDMQNVRPTVKLLDAIRSRIEDAVELLREPDLDKKRIAFILLAIQESTEVRKHLRNGKTITRVYVTDQDLYHWGIEQLHAMAIST